MSIYLKIQKYDHSYANIILLLKDKHFCKNVMHLELLENKMLTNISSHTHSTKHQQWLACCSVSHNFSGPFTPLKNIIICLIRSHALTASRPTKTIVIIQSGLSYCQVSTSAYVLYIFFCTYFTSFSAFMYSFLTDDLCWLLIGYSILDALFLIWLFPYLVVLKMSVFYIANLLLLYAICLNLYWESQSGCLSFS